ncbi:dihydrodipicolinate synthetase [Tricladium varicosporioides]|nr:dihydrodipicolinate synthetase [Hymenoscyphus varicosporioides]
MQAPTELPVKSRTAGNEHTYPVPGAGCYVPAITFFHPDTDSLCPFEQGKYYSYLSKTGLKGLVILGTNAETFLLTREERKALLELARASVASDFPIIAGVSGHSTAQVLEYIKDAHEAGANFALVLPCAYFGKQTTPEVVKRFYGQIATVSPLPLIIYNFPAVCNGLDLDSEIITEIVVQNPKIVGVKLACGSVAKITRLSATFSPNRFAIFGGQSDFLIGGLAAGSAGCIAAFANVVPQTVTRIFNLWSQGKYHEAQELQRIAALAESPTKAGIANTKYAAAIFTAPRAGISNAVPLLKPRKPYREPSEEVMSKIQDVMAEADRKEAEIISMSLNR